MRSISYLPFTIDLPVWAVPFSIYFPFRQDVSASSVLSSNHSNLEVPFFFLRVSDFQTQELIYNFPYFFDSIFPMQLTKGFLEQVKDGESADCSCGCTTPQAQPGQSIVRSRRGESRLYAGYCQPTAHPATNLVVPKLTIGASLLE